MAGTGDANEPENITEAPETDTHPVDPEPDKADTTVHAPLSQWASRAGKRPDSEAGKPPELQSPTDPWPEPIQGLNPPLGQPYEDRDLLEQFGAPAKQASDLVPSRPARGNRYLAPLAIVAVALLLGGGLITAVVRLNSGKKPETPAAATSFPAALLTAGPANTPSAQPSASSSAVDDSPVPTGPIAQGVVPQNENDLEEICDGLTYWPMLPKRSATKAPHPIEVLDENLGDGLAGDKRGPRSMFRAWFQRSQSLKAAWQPIFEMTDTAAKVQLVACLDRTATGAKVRACKATNPDRTVTLYHATWRLRVFETATGKLLLNQVTAAKDTSCPDAGLLGLAHLTDNKAYMAIDDYSLIAALKPLVER